MNTVAYLAPEIPSVSATFVYREICALERQGVRVVPFTMRRVGLDAVAADGAPLYDRTSVVYRRGGTWLGWALLFMLCHPAASARVFALAIRDAVRGDLPGPIARAKTIVQSLAGLSIARTLRREKARQLHVHFANAAASVGMYAARAAGIPFSVTGHANDLLVEPVLLPEKLERAAPFVTISEANQRFLTKRYGAAARGVQLVRCGVDLRQFPFVERPADDHPVVLTVGRLVAKKGVDLLLRAFSVLQERLPSARLEIIGDGPLRPELEQLAENLGLVETVRFRGAVPTREIRAALERASVFVLASRRDADGDMDGIPVALMEAMASGVPCISTQISGIPELIRHRQTGWLVAPEDAEGLAVCLTEALGCPSDLRQVGAESRRFIGEQFDLNKNAMALERQWADAAAA